MSLYAKNVGGRMMPKFVGPSGLDSVLQPAIFGNGISVLSPGSGSSPSYFGMGGASATGALSHPALSSVDQRQQTRRMALTSTATANSTSGLRYALTQCWRGDTPGLGGFYHVSRFAVPAAVANQRVMVGLFSTVAALGATQVPSALQQCVFAGWDSGDANLQILSNDAVGACAKVDLGPQFPANDPSAVYEVTFFAAPNAATCSWRAKNLVNGAEAGGVIADGDLPLTTTFLAWQFAINNGGTAQAVSIEIMRMYLETDY